VTPFAWWRWIRRIVLTVVLGTILYVAFTAAHIWWVAGHDDRPRSDAIVVLGAAEYNGRPSPVLAARLRHAATLWRNHVAPRIITVGGRETGDVYTEGQAGRNFLTRHGVPASAVVAVPLGTDTLQNTRAVAAEMHRHGWKSAVFVTDPWNCLRARTMARDQGLTAVTSPEHSGPAVGSFTTDVKYVARETEAYIYYQIFGNDNQHSPGVV
jgi:uncharacterized SAM-binding protein YcdF (DUF218 family)